MQSFPLNSLLYISIGEKTRKTAGLFLCVTKKLRTPFEEMVILRWDRKRGRGNLEFCFYAFSTPLWFWLAFVIFLSFFFCGFHKKASTNGWRNGSDVIQEVEEGWGGVGQGVGFRHQICRFCFICFVIVIVRPIFVMIFWGGKWRIEWGREIRGGQRERLYR